MPKEFGRMGRMTTSDELRLLGEAIRTARAVLGLTQDQVADRGGPSDVTIRGLENGLGKKPNGDTLRKLETAFRWPRGAAAKIMNGDAEVVVDQGPDGQEYPVLLDYEAAMRDMPPPDVQAELDERSAAQYEAEQASYWAERPIYEQSTADLLAEITSRMNSQEKRIRELESERASLLVRLKESSDVSANSDGGPRSAGETSGPVTRLSDRRPRLISDDAPEGWEELPSVADEEKPGDDPGEDND